MHMTALSSVLRCSSPRGYRLPPCALINLSYGARTDHTLHKLTAIVKPQPAAATNFDSRRQLGGLNHSPRSPFIPTQVRNLFFMQNVKIFRNAFSKMAYHSLLLFHTYLFLPLTTILCFTSPLLFSITANRV